MTVDRVLELRSSSLRHANYICPRCGNPNYMRWLNNVMSDDFDLKCINCNSYFLSRDLYVGKHEKKG